MTQSVYMRYMEEEMTIEVLARMVASSFIELQNSMNTRFDRVESEIRAINKRIDESVMPLLDDHSRRIKDLELAS